MNYTLGFARIIYFLLCIICTLFYFIAGSPAGNLNAYDAMLGLGLGVFAGSTLIVVDLLLRPFRMRELLLTIMGLLIGYALAAVMWMPVSASLAAVQTDISDTRIGLLRLGLTLLGTYIGIVFVARSSEEWYLSIPFIRLKPQMTKKKDILIDGSALHDPRLIDLASLGLVDQHLVLPRFILNDFYSMLDEGDDAQIHKARRAIETVKKLEGLADLDLRFEDSVIQSEDPAERILKLARLLNANILTADMGKIRVAGVEGVRVINLHTLSNSLKPIMQSGECLEIKIQRQGKEPRQGVGYLDDGTMVVVNGGGDYIGQTIQAAVLSVKHTSSGRMIFCNAMEEAAPGYTPVAGPGVERINVANAHS